MMPWWAMLMEIVLMPHSAIISLTQELPLPEFDLLAFSYWVSCSEVSVHVYVIPYEYYPPTSAYYPVVLHSICHWQLIWPIIIFGYSNLNSVSN